tara:strand:+ start:82 stop:234 length:153 start_codon:yes stop_codon:yes gene_type:complete
MINNEYLIIYLDIFAFVFLIGFFAFLFKSSSSLKDKKKDACTNMENFKKS